MNWTAYITILLVLLLPCLGKGQDLNNTLFKSELNGCQFDVQGGLIVLSTVRLYQGSKYWDNIRLDIQEETATIIGPYCDTIQAGGTFTIEYRTFPFQIEKTLSLLDTNRMQAKSTETYVGYHLNPFQSDDTNAIIDNGLNYNGSFSRGFSVGTAQSLVVNSNFDLQMSGDLGNGLRLTAAISDDNIPIQPEGNTQILQEFDRVYIEVSKDRHSIIAGDFVLRRPKSYFLNFNKKLKGIGGTTSVNINDETTVQTNVNIAASRGKFRRQTLSIKEGNQGPYRLNGNNDERFIIVLSGTEKVYYNGLLIKRGLENDYIIDYNTADIIFSPNRLVSKETRVIVEFEYTVLNYNRSLYSLQSNIASRDYEVNINFYSEQDGKNTANQIEFDSTDLRILGESGDDRMAAFRSGVRAIDGELISNVGYRQIVNPNYPLEPDPFILTYEPNGDSATVVAIFTEVGTGLGAYSIDQSIGVNGRVYTYVGEGNGRYAPVIELIPPERRRALSIGGKYRVLSNTEITGELALSDFDLNRFSTIDDQDNIGFAGQIGYNSSFKIGDSTDWRVTNSINFELIDADYNPLNPYRNAEFARDWNTAQQFEDKEALFNGTLGVRRSNGDGIDYKFGSYTIRSKFEGYRHGAQFKYNHKGFSIRGNPSFTMTDNKVTSSRFYRPNFEASQSFRRAANLTFGVNYEGENNEIRSLLTDELDKAAYSFDYWKTFIRTDDTKPAHLLFSYNKRVDRFSNLTAIAPAIDIDEIEFGGGWEATPNSILKLSLKTRDFEVLEPLLVNNESSKRTILGALDYYLKALDGGIISSTNYQLNSGQEPKLEFVFEKVENFQGDYVFVGSDTSSVKNINDFRFDPTNPLSEYVRIVVPNNEFIRTNNLGFNQSLRIVGRQIFRQDTIPFKGYRKLLSKFSTNSTIRILNKSMDDSGTQIDPLGFFAVDSSLVSFSSLNTHAIYFNRGNPTYDLGFTFRNNSNKQNQINGYEQRTLLERELRLRWNVIRASDFILTASHGRKSYDSKLFDSRDFHIDFIRINPELNIRVGTSTRVVLLYKYDRKAQQINGLEQSISHDGTIQFNRRQANNSSFDATISVVDVDYTGEANTPIEYDILEGLKDGINYLWRLSFTKRLANNIDLSLTYDGRKTGSAESIHIGRVQAKATF